MKKVVTLILALIYFTASSGVVLNVHYCMGKISKVNIDNFSSAICKCGNPAKSKSCCRNEFKVVKLDDVHKASVISQKFETSPAPLPIAISLIDHSTFSIASNTKAIEHGPPLQLSSCIYLQNSVFRI